MVWGREGSGRELSAWRWSRGEETLSVVEESVPQHGTLQWVGWREPHKSSTHLHVYLYIYRITFSGHVNCVLYETSYINIVNP